MRYRQRVNKRLFTPCSPSWLRDWGWSEEISSPRSVYIHIPFCRHRCGYCNFTLLADRDDLHRRFLNCLDVELSALGQSYPIETIFLGGGTPSALNAESIERLMNSLRVWFNVCDTVEWSFEANPLDLTVDRCRQLRELGVTRISLGGQSFDAAKLHRLERDHTGAELIEAIDRAKNHFDNVSLDLIFAAPEETLDVWQSDLLTAAKTGVDHISTYGLTYEKGSRFWGMRERRQIEALPEELELQMYERGIDYLVESGFEHYEVSNFARPGKRCKHNQAYWQGLGWWAFGPSAARFVGCTRSVNHRGVLEYMRRIEAGENPTTEVVLLSPEQQFREKFVFAMRQLEGVNWIAVKQNADREITRDIEAAFMQHVANGWMQYDGTTVKLTRAGLVVSDGLWSEYL